MSDDDIITRRSFLASTVIASGALAGCPADSGDDETMVPTTGSTDADTPGGTATATATETATPAPESVFDAFVETDGTEFVVDGEPAYYTGTSNLGLAQPDTGPADVDAFFAAVSEMGVDLVRTGAFGAGADQRLQPAPGEFNETAFESLDRVVASAGQHGVRLVCPLTSYENDYGGIPQYAEWAGTDETGFYGSSDANERYREFVETLLTRENTVTGLEYRKDPTIAVWELADRAVLPGDEDNVGRLQTWIESTAEFVNSIDDAHLVATGMEGREAIEGSRLEKSPYDWSEPLWNGRPGESYVRNNAPDVVDVASFQLYPSTHSLTPAEAREWIRKHLREAESLLGKPAYLAEFGMSVSRLGDNGEDLRARDRAFRRWFDACNEHDANAVLVRGLTPASEDLGRYDVSMDRESTVRTIQTYDGTVAEKPIPAGQRNEDPTAGIEMSTPSALPGEEVTFDGSDSSDPDGKVAFYDWLLGADRSAQGEQVSATFEQFGQYDVELMVTDDDGATATASASLTVAEESALPLYQITGSGTDVYGDTNDFFYVYTTLSGDGSMKARVASVENTDGWAKAGVMVRDVLEEDSPHAATGQTPRNGQQFLWANDYGQETDGNNPIREVEPPAWARIERQGSTVTGYASNDGENWTETGSQEIELGEEVYIGLFVYSHIDDTENTSVIDSVSGLGDDWESTAIGDAEGSVSVVE
jgi:mannan endo-1,4-beta-mannosidase